MLMCMQVLVVLGGMEHTIPSVPYLLTPGGVPDVAAYDNGHGYGGTVQ